MRLSSQAKALSSTSTGGVFDTKKVEEIKAAIASGQFQVDAAKIDEALARLPESPSPLQPLKPQSP